MADQNEEFVNGPDDYDYANEIMDTPDNFDDVIDYDNIDDYNIVIGGTKIEPTDNSAKLISMINDQLNEISVAGQKLKKSMPMTDQDIEFKYNELVEKYNKVKVDMKGMKVKDNGNEISIIEVPIINLKISEIEELIKVLRNKVEMFKSYMERQMRQFDLFGMFERRDFNRRDIRSLHKSNINDHLNIFKE